MKPIVQKLFPILCLIFAISFNLYIYRAETTITVDPNDNAFQYALVARTNEIWDYACSKSPNVSRTLPAEALAKEGCVSHLIDHWVPNWAAGYNLPFYYSHVPQIAIVASYRLINFFLSNVLHTLPAEALAKEGHLSLFSYFHFLTYLMLSIFPLSIFIALKVLKRSWLEVSIGALLASHISTDGFYGLDQSSYLWRGWGLSSQLFASIFFPLAIAYSIRAIEEFNYFSTVLTTNHILKELNNCWCAWKRNVGTIVHLVSGKNRDDRDNDRRTSFKYVKSSQYDRHSSSLFYAILFLTLTTASHLGIGLMAFLTLPIIALTPWIIALFHQSKVRELWSMGIHAIIKTIIIAVPPLLILSYWIVPTITQNVFHNVSWWDPIWKFNSYGMKEVLTNLFNGNLFDFARLPIMTISIFLGLYALLIKNNTKYSILDTRYSPSPLPFLFFFFLALYFGSTTWGKILYLIPGMNEFHQHRFIVGLDVIALLLIPIGISFSINYIINKCMSVSFLKKELNNETETKSTTYKEIVHLANEEKLYDKNSTQRASFFTKTNNYAINSIHVLIITSIVVPILYNTYKQTLSYASYNDTLIAQANAKFQTQHTDAELLVTTLKALPIGRVFAGRGGGWGKKLMIGETTYYLYLSTHGLSTVLWLPETWSNNSDTEQFFMEENPKHYELYNITYIVTPVDQTPQKFWLPLMETPSWKLYTTNESIKNDYSVIAIPPSAGEAISTIQQWSNSNFIGIGVSPSVVYTTKRSFINVVRLWIQSPYSDAQIFPELRIQSQQFNNTTMQQYNNSQTLPHFFMINESTYITPDGKSHSLIAEQPIYINPLQTESNATMKQFNNVVILNSTASASMVYSATVKIEQSSNPTASGNNTAMQQSNITSCPTCIVYLKNTYHPNWKAYVNGKKTETINVFPSYVGVRIETPGVYEVVFKYEPSWYKVPMIMGSILLSIILMIGISKCIILLQEQP